MLHVARLHDVRPPRPRLADVSADDWYDVTDSDGEDVVTVAYFEDSDSVDRSKRLLAGITKTASEAFGVEVTDDDIDDLVRTSGNYLYWWNSADGRGRRRRLHEPLASGPTARPRRAVRE
jgi:hypothetical protein